MPLDKAEQLLKKFAALAPTMQVSTAMVLLHIARHGDSENGVTTKDLSERFQLTSASASRNVYYWGDGTLGISEALAKDRQFVKITIDKCDRRRRLIQLTKEGKAFVDELMEILQA